MRLKRLQMGGYRMHGNHVQRIRHSLSLEINKIKLLLLIVNVYLSISFFFFT